MRIRLPVISLLAVLAAVAVAGCGGSSKAPGVETAPSSGTTQPVITSASTTATTPTTTATTPKPPSPLAKKPVVVVPKGAAPTKLIIKDLIVGAGKTAKVGDTITVNYVGVLYKNGKEFDSSWKTGQPATFPLTHGGLIAGWVNGLPGMKVGGRRELIIPAAQAYGAAGRPGIPPNSALVFVVDLLST